MDIIKAALLGLIQGVTEFLPVSSSGHLAVFGRNEEFLNLYLIVMLHMGTFFSIVVYYRRDVAELIRGGLRLLVALPMLVRDRAGFTSFIRTDVGARLALLVAVGTIPTGLIGLGLKSVAEYSASPGNTKIVGVFFIITGILMYLCDRFPAGAKAIGQGGAKDAIMVGVFQGIAALPGLSRSGLTVFAATIRGFERRDAAKFSFLMALPALLGAALLELREGGGRLAPLPTLVGAAVAFVAGYFSLSLLVRLLASRKLRYFTGYLVALGLLVLLFM